MASIYGLKPKFQALLRPLCARLADRGITANQVTITAALISIAEGAAIALTHGALWTLLLLPVVLFLRMAMNALDGMLAREFGHKSKLGAVLNELGDVVSDAALYLPFALIAGISPLFIVLIVLVAVIGEMAGVVGVQIGSSRRYDGPFGKSDRAVFFGALALVLAAGVTPGAWSDIVLGVALATAVFTVINRARHALAESKKTP